MSAFFVSKSTIDDVITMTRPALMSNDTAANEYGKVLWMMNALAVGARYEEDHSEYADTISAYTFEEGKDISEAQQLKSLECFLYQCSEGDVPEMSLFRKLDKFCDEMTVTLSKGRQKEKFGQMRPFIEGYDEAQWGR